LPGREVGALALEDLEPVAAEGGARPPHPPVHVRERQRPHGPRHTGTPPGRGGGEGGGVEGAVGSVTKFWVTATVWSRLRTMCHQCGGT